MGNIFAELTQMGFSNLEDITIYTKPNDNSQRKETSEKKKWTLEEVLYDKSYTCPICQKTFKSKSIRSGKNRLLTVDVDLKPNYDIINPLIYECVVCENCGYAALGKAFHSLSSLQIRWIKEKICSQYKPYSYPPYLTEKEAILKHKMALLNASVKNAKNGEKAYICLKMAWLYRDMKDKMQEELFLKYALEGFENAYHTERFPIFELGELTTAYIIATLYRGMAEYDKALKWLGIVIMDKSVSLRLKAKALYLKGLIAEEKKKQLQEDIK